MDIEPKMSLPGSEEEFKRSNKQLTMVATKAEICRSAPATIDDGRWSLPMAGGVCPCEEDDVDLAADGLKPSKRSRIEV